MPFHSLDPIAAIHVGMPVVQVANEGWGWNPRNKKYNSSSWLVTSLLGKRGASEGFCGSKLLKIIGTSPPTQFCLYLFRCLLVNKENKENGIIVWENTDTNDKHCPGKRQIASNHHIGSPMIMDWIYPPGPMDAIVVFIQVQIRIPEPI